MRSASIFLILLLASSLGAFAAKEALLIANADYAHFGKLPNPISDAQQLADVLRHLGFNVSLVENASREGMLDALGAFEGRLKVSHGIAFFHYGGHGVQVSGKNFLIPADADIPDEKRVATRAVELDEVMTALDASGSDANIVVLDACRDNPLPATSSRSATRGLSVVAKKPKNSIIIYAAEADSKAQDGLFTPALARALASSGKTDISEVMKQVRREVYEASGGTQTPGQYDQSFGKIALGDESANLPPISLPSSSAPAEEKSRPAVATKEAPFVNSLGMKFVPVPGTGVLFSVLHTRVQDFRHFADASGIADKIWQSPGFEQGDDYPVVNVSWEEAKEFCRWLTEKERREGKIGAEQEYRLPTDAEWSVAAGRGKYPWGDQWPPPVGAGDYNPSLGVDSYKYTSPCGQMGSNKLGLCDMGGNVWQWCEDWYRAGMNDPDLLEKYPFLKDDGGGQTYRVVRGASWSSSVSEFLRSSCRARDNPGYRSTYRGFRCVLDGGSSRYGDSLPSSSAPAIASLPTPARAQPQETILAYYELINAGNYRGAWNMLPESLQENRKVHPNGFSSFEEWFGPMKPITITDARVLQQTGDEASIEVSLRCTINRKTSSMALRYALVWDLARQEWRIQSIKKAQ